jgi:hypothetical protein
MLDELIELPFHLDIVLAEMTESLGGTQSRIRGHGHSPPSHPKEYR